MPAAKKIGGTEKPIVESAGYKFVNPSILGKLPPTIGSLALLLAMPCLVHRQHMGNVSIGFCLTPVNVSERLVGDQDFSLDGFGP